MLVLYLDLGKPQFLLLVWEPRTALPFMLVSVLISLALVPTVLSAHQAALATPARASVAENCFRGRRTPGMSRQCAGTQGERTGAKSAAASGKSGDVNRPTLARPLEETEGAADAQTDVTIVGVRVTAHAAAQ